MLTRSRLRHAQRRAAERILDSGLVITTAEAEAIEVADLGLGELHLFGLQILAVAATETYAAKIIALEPWQICPQHRHPRLGDYPGKQETLRVQAGELLLGMEGNATPGAVMHIPRHRAHTFTARHVLWLSAGQSHTFPPDTWHWFQAGRDGAVVWSFSSQAFDVQDEFSDPDIRRVTEVVDG